MNLRLSPLLSIKKLLFIQALSFILALLTMQQGQAADLLASNSTDRAALTQEILEIQRDLLLLKEKHLAEERLGLTIYLNINTLTLNRLDSISILLDDQIIFQDKIDQKQLDMLLAGSMKKLHTHALRPGSYKLKAIMKAGGKTLSNTFTLEKSTGRDNLKIILVSSLQQRAPEIIFDHEIWPAAQ